MEQIVSGPSGPEPPKDGDRVFRSLTVDPTNSAILVLGTERNGFVRSLDGGLTWMRHRTGFRPDGDSYPEVWDIDISRSEPCNGAGGWLIHLLNQHPTGIGGPGRPAGARQPVALPPIT